MHHGVIAMRHWIGCSGWQYQEWQGKLYPQKLPKSCWLEFYAQKFNTVEVNNTFYRFPTPKMLLKWRDLTPEYFRYSLKANRSITHFHRFHQTEKIIRDFYALSDVLGDKLGFVLFQLPKNISYDLDFLKSVLKQLSHNKKNAIEFQHNSWWRQEVLDIFLKANVTFVNVNSPIIHQAFVPTGDFCYLRFHGLNHWYQGAYRKKFLLDYIYALNNSPIKEAWCYFDNTAHGAAVHDALSWQKLISE